MANFITKKNIMNDDIVKYEWNFYGAFNIGMEYI